MPEITISVFILSVLAALGLGFLIAVLIWRNKLAKKEGELSVATSKVNELYTDNAEKIAAVTHLTVKLEDARRDCAVLDEQVRSLNVRGKELIQKNEMLSSEKDALTRRLAESMASCAATEEANKNLKEWIEKADTTMKDSFTSISKNIAENNTKVFLEGANDKLNDFASKLGENLNGNNEKVNGMIKPVDTELKELHNKVVGLTERVENLRKTNTELQDATTLLNNTLRNNAQRGKWGEQQLHKIAELAGMVEHIDFEEQYVNEEGTRPDMIINLTGERTVPVDSKAPMAAYMQYLEDNDEQSRQKHLNEHVRALRHHIDELNRKAYWKIEERSIEMVAMVVPYESGLSAAFTADREIFSYAMEKNVLLLSPMTFYAFLKSVSIGWKENAMSQNAREIANLSKELIDRFGKFFDYFENVGKSLDNAKKQYDNAVSSYNRRLLPTFNKFNTLSTGSKEELLPENENLFLGENNEQ